MERLIEASQAKGSGLVIALCTSHLLDLVSSFLDLLHHFDLCSGFRILISLCLMPELYHKYRACCSHPIYGTLTCGLAATPTACEYIISLVSPVQPYKWIKLKLTVIHLSSKNVLN